MQESNREREYIEIRRKFLLDNAEFMNGLRDDYLNEYIDMQPLGITKLFGKIPRINILILTVNDIETYSLHKRLLPIDGETHIIKLSIADKVLFIGKMGDYNVIHMVTEMGSDTLHGTYESLKWLKERLQLRTLIKIRLILSVGVCYGIDWLQTDLCDVMAPHIVITFDKNIKYSGDAIKQRHVRAYGTECVLNDIIQTVTDSNNAKPDKTFRIHKRTLMTGEVLVDSSRFKERILASLKEYQSAGKYQYNDIYGGDMEAFGMYKAVAKELPNGKVDKNSKLFDGCSCLTIKGICDFGEFKNVPSESSTEDADAVKDKLQLLAAKNACDVCEELLKSGPEHKKMKLIDNSEKFRRRNRMKRNSLVFLGVSLLINLLVYSYEAMSYFGRSLDYHYPSAIFIAVNIIILLGIFSIIYSNVAFERKKSQIKKSSALTISFVRDPFLFFIVSNESSKTEISDLIVKSLRISSDDMLVNYDLNKALRKKGEKSLKEGEHRQIIVDDLLKGLLDKDESGKFEFLKYSINKLKIEIVLCYRDSYQNTYEQKYFYDSVQSQERSETSVKNG